MQESQTSTITATNTRKLLSKEIKQLKQCSRCSCLMISGLSYAKNKCSETAAKTTNSVKDILINHLEIDPDKLNMELNKVHRLPLNSVKSKTQCGKTVLNVICCFKSHSIRDKLYEKWKMIYEKSKQTMNSLTKKWSTLQGKAQTHINSISRVKFCFSNPNGNLKVKFDDNKNTSFDSIQFLCQSIEEKLRNNGIYEKLYSLEDSN